MHCKRACKHALHLSNTTCLYHSLLLCFTCCNAFSQITSEDPASIPKWIEVDLTGVVAGDKIDTSHFRLPEGVELWKPERPFSNGKVMGTVIGKQLRFNCLYPFFYQLECVAVRMLSESRRYVTTRR
jgi:hypothetical protein